MGAMEAIAPRKRARKIFLIVSGNKFSDGKVLSLIPFVSPPVISNSHFEGFEDILTHRPKS